MKKFASFLLSLCMMLCYIPSVSAEEAYVKFVNITEFGEHNEPVGFELSDTFDEFKTACVCVFGDEGDTYTLTGDYNNATIYTNGLTVNCTGNINITDVVIAGNGKIVVGDYLEITPETQINVYNGSLTDINDLLQYSEENNFNDQDQKYRFFGDCTLDWFLRAYKFVVDEGVNVTVNGIIDTTYAEINGNMFIKAPEFGDPNGFNILKDGDLSVGENGSLTADEGQVLVLGEFATYSGITLYEQDGVNEFMLPEDHGWESANYHDSKWILNPNDNPGGFLSDNQLQFQTDTNECVLKLKNGDTLNRDGIIDFEEGLPLTFKIETFDPLTIDSLLGIELYQEQEPVMTVELTDINENGEFTITPISSKPILLYLFFDQQNYDYVHYSHDEGEVIVEYSAMGMGFVNYIPNDDIIDSISYNNFTKLKVKEGAGEIRFNIIPDDKSNPEVKLEEIAYPGYINSADNDEYYNKDENIFVLPLSGMMGDFYSIEFRFTEFHPEEEPNPYDLWDYDFVFDYNDYDGNAKVFLVDSDTEDYMQPGEKRQTWEDEGQIKFKLETPEGIEKPYAIEVFEKFGNHLMPIQEFENNEYTYNFFSRDWFWFKIYWTEKEYMLAHTKYGDVNNDNEISMKDVTLIQKHIAEIIKFDNAALFAADVDQNETVNLKDVTHIQRFLADLLSEDETILRKN